MRWGRMLALVVSFVLVAKVVSFLVDRLVDLL